VSMTGEESILPSKGEGLAVPLTQSPRYLLFRGDQAPTYLGGWRPQHDIQRVVRGPEASLPIVFDPVAGLPMHGEAQVWAGGALRGSLRVDIGPIGEQMVRVPVNLDGLQGDVPAAVHLVLDEPAMRDLHVAEVWLQIADAPETEE